MLRKITFFLSTETQYTSDLLKTRYDSTTFGLRKNSILSYSLEERKKTLGFWNMGKYFIKQYLKTEQLKEKMLLFINSLEGLHCACFSAGRARTLRHRPLSHPVPLASTARHAQTVWPGLTEEPAMVLAVGWMVASPKIYPSGTCECDLFEKRVTTDVIQLRILRWDHSRWPLRSSKSHDKCPYWKRRQRKRPGEGGRRECSDV